MTTTSALFGEDPLLIPPKLAADIGLNEAIILQQIHFWLMVNAKKKSRRHYHDGRWWTYNTVEEWTEQFPFWSASTVWRTLSKLEKSDYIVSGNYNSTTFDRTKWYSINYDQIPRIELQPGPPPPEDDLPSSQDDEMDPPSRQSEQMPFGQSDEMRSKQNDEMDRANLGRPIPETTPETTPERENARHRDPLTFDFSVQPIPALSRSAETNGTLQPKRGRVTSDFFDPRKVASDGLIPLGKGKTPIEIHREFFDWRDKNINALSTVNCKIVMDEVKDLDRWRLVCKAWSGAGNLGRNRKGLMDWYYGEIPAKDRPEPRRAQPAAQATFVPSLMKFD